MYKVFAAVILAVSALAVPPVAASAAPPEPCHTTVLKTAMTPTKNVVGVKVVKTSTYTVVLDNNCDNPGMSVLVASTEDVVGHSITMNSPGGDGADRYTFTGSISWDPATMNNAQYAGSWISVVDVFSDNGPSLTVPGVDFRVVRAATATAKTSAVASAGDALSVSGLLTRASWDSRRYERFGGQQVDLQFKAAGGSYVTVTSVRSSSNGALLSTVRASVDGCYRYVYRGDATTVSTPSPAACVDVR